MDDKTTKFISILIAACKNVSSEYFSISQFGAKDVSRERVYCYELYHQLRILLKDEAALSDISLMGEMDKASNSNFNDEIPDFIFHVPGTSNNLIIVEVKRSINPNRHSDFKKLEKFVNNYGYQVGIALWYGPNPPSEIEKATIPSNCFLIYQNSAVP